MTTTTALTLPERAAVALGAAEHEKQLILLVAESQTITEIKNPDGRHQCHSAYMKLKNARVAISTSSKTAREDATAFSKAVIAEEKRLITITEAEENRLQQIRDQWDADREAERQAAIAAERDRVDGIQKMINALRAYPVAHAVSDASTLKASIDGLAGRVPSADDYAEFVPAAAEAIATSLATMRAMLATVIAKENAEALAKAEREAEAAQIKADREALAKMRAENEARRQEAEAKAAAEHAAAQAELVAQRNKLNAEMEAQRAELELQQAEIARQQAAMAAAQRLQEEVAAAARHAEEAEDMHLLQLERQEAAEQAANRVALPELTTLQPGAPVAAFPFPVKNSEPATPPSLRLGQIAERLGFNIPADFLRELGFAPAGKDRAAVLYHQGDFDGICVALIERIGKARMNHRMAVAA